MKPLCLVAALVLTGCASNDAPRSDPPPAEPEVFAPEVISTGNVYRGAFTRDGRTFYYFKKRGTTGEDYRIYRSVLASGEWSEPAHVDLGGDHSDLYPTISPDGSRMVFSSYRPVPGETEPATNANLWYTDWVNGAWATPVFMSEVSTLENYDAKPLFGTDGIVYFETTTPDWRTKKSLMTQWVGDRYQAPEVFEAIEQWRDWRDDLFVWGGVPGPDGSFVVLDVSDREATTGRALASDQWISIRAADGSWHEPVRLGDGLNSDGYDNFTFFSADGAEMFFVRDFDQFYRVGLDSVLDGVRTDR